MKLVQKFGGREAAKVVTDIVDTARLNDMSADQVRTALAVSAIDSTGESGFLLEKISEYGTATRQQLANLFDAVQRKVEDSEFIKYMSQTVQELQNAQEVQKLIEDGALESIKPLEEKAAEADKEKENAEQELEKKQNEKDAISQDLLSAVSEFLQNPSNQKLNGITDQLRKKLEGAAQVVTEYEQSLRNAEERSEAAERDLDDARKEKMSEIRQIAEQNVQQREQAEAEQKAAEAEAARVAEEQAQVEAQQKQETDNENLLEEDNFIDTVYNGYSDDVKDAARQQWRTYKGSASPVLPSESNFINALSKKYGVRIQVMDTHGLFNGVSLGTGRIILDANAIKGKQGLAIKEILTHELTHQAEQSQYYDALKDAVIDYAYGGNAEAFADAAAQLGEAYKSQVGQADGERELVAKTVGKLLSDSGYVNKMTEQNPGLVRRILTAIQDFLAKITGMNDPEVDNIRNIAKLLDKSLQDAHQKNIENGVIPQHETAAEFSVPQIAEAVGLKLEYVGDGDAKVPYHMVDKNGKVVQEITPEMVENTPMGKLISSAVKAKNVDTETGKS